MLGLCFTCRRLVVKKEKGIEGKNVRSVCSRLSGNPGYLSTFVEVRSDNFLTRL
jgi:hypothetical protein